MSEYEKCREVLRKRLELESKLVADIRRECLRVLLKIVEIGYGSGVKGEFFKLIRITRYDEVRELLSELRQYLYMVIERDSEELIADISDKWNVAIPLVAGTVINRDVGGKTLKQRIGVYGNRFETEADMWTAVGLINKYSKKKIEAAITSHLDAPYSSRLFLMSIGKGISQRLKYGTPHFGKGQDRSAVSMLERLAVSTLGDAMREAEWDIWGDDSNIIGFEVHRGSSYPCSLCDSMCGFHMKTYADLPPYHARCCCYAVPVVSLPSDFKS